MRPVSMIVSLSVIAIVLLSGGALAYGNQYGDPPQFSRPLSIVTDGGWTAVGAPNETLAMNEQTPDCPGFACSYASGGPNLLLTVYSQPVQQPAIYDQDTMSLNQTLWFQAMSVGSGTAEQLGIVVRVAGTAIIVAQTIVLLSRTSWQVFMFRMPADLTGYFGPGFEIDLLPRLLAAGETARASWVVLMFPGALGTPATPASAFPLIIGLSGLLLLVPLLGERTKRRR